MEDLTDDQIIELGNFCEGLRLSPKFALLVKQYELRVIHDFMNTDPHESKKREGIYASCSGFRDFQTYMNAFVDARDKIEQANKPIKGPSEYEPQVEDVYDAPEVID